MRNKKRNEKLAGVVFAVMAILPIAGCATDDATGDDSAIGETSSGLSLGGGFYDGSTLCTVGGATMHCCPGGTAMIGAHVGRNIFKCASAPLAGMPFLDVGTQRDNLHACQPGSVMVGFQAGKNQFACQTTAETILDEVVDAGTQDTQPGRPVTMHVCPERNGWAMAGIHVDKNQLLCDR
jgi:hypothetical protein